MKTSKAAISLGLIILMSSLGIVFAGWTDQVYIEGVANMGSLTLAFDDEEPPICTEFHKIDDEGPLIPGEYLGKDVAWCEAYYDEKIQDVHTEKFGYKKLFIEMWDVYPSIHIRTTYLLHNIGTIPVSVYEYMVCGEIWSSQTGLKVCDLIIIKISDQEYIVYEDLNCNGVLDEGEPAVIEMRLTNSLPTQIDPCNTDKREVDLHFLQPARECHIYKLCIEINGIEWNKLYEIYQDS